MPPSTNPMMTASVATSERRATTPDEARGHVAPVEVATEQVTGRRAGLGERAATGDLGGDRTGVVDRQHRRQDRERRPRARASRSTATPRTPRPFFRRRRRPRGRSRPRRSRWCPRRPACRATASPTSPRSGSPAIGAPVGCSGAGTADPRVEHHVERVDGEVDQHVADGDDRDVALQLDDLAGVDRLVDRACRCRGSGRSPRPRPRRR